MSFKIDSQLSENQIESDVASYLGYITPFWTKRFRLISIDEQHTGADKLFNRFLPIYLQFKVSHGLNPNSTIILKFQNRPLANIISYRATNNLSANPILYFQLRKKAKTAIDFQHNILRQLNTPPFQFALYVAPLTLRISEYEKLLNVNWFRKIYPLDPFYYKEIEIHDPSIHRNIILGMNPFLRHHISIPPHMVVTTHNHHYSYSKSGGDLAWHGGQMFNEDFRLSTQLLRILNYVYNSERFGFGQEEYIDFIAQFNKNNNLRTINTSNIDDRNYKISTIREFAQNLKSNFNIKLLLLTQPK